MTGLRACLAVVATLLASAAWAQQSPMPEEIAWKLLEIGRVVDPPKTAALYAPMQEKEPYHGVKIERDVKYGPAERNLLDVFMPEASSAARPVLIYRPWRRVRCGQQAQPRQPLLRQHHAVGGEERLCRRQHHLSPCARLAMAGGRGRPRRRRAMG